MINIYLIDEFASEQFFLLQQRVFFHIVSEHISELLVGSEDSNLITFQCQRTLLIIIFTISPDFIALVDLPRIAEAHPKKMQLTVSILIMF